MSEHEQARVDAEHEDEAAERDWDIRLVLDVRAVGATSRAQAIEMAMDTLRQAEDDDFAVETSEAK